MTGNLRLSTRFTLLLSIVLAIGIVATGLVLWQVLEQRAQAQITSNGLMLLETMNSVRTYTSNHVRPLLAEEMTSNTQFIPETVPAFSAREVFEFFRLNEGNENFLYKEATLNPMNLRNQADSFETELVEQMRRDPAELSNFRELGGERVFFIARPLAVGSESCLECHSTPEAAPASLINTYGSEHGFGWELGEIVAAQIIYVPAEEVFNNAFQSFSLVMGIVIAAFVLVVVLINFLLKQYVIQPVAVMGGLAQKISTDQMVTDDLEAGNLSQITRRADELGYLAQVFRRMAREVYARTENLKKEVQKLAIEIDQIKREKQVAEITSTDYFQDLQSKAQQLRRERSRKPGEVPTAEEESVDQSETD